MKSMDNIIKNHQRISNQYAKTYINTLGVDGRRQPAQIYSLTKLKRMERLRDASIQKVIAVRQCNN